MRRKIRITCRARTKGNVNHFNAIQEKRGNMRFFGVVEKEVPPDSWLN